MSCPTYDEQMNSMANRPEVQIMQHFRHHGQMTTYDHSVNVMKMSVAIARKLNMTDAQIENVIVGAMLHDFFLYDYYETGRIRKEGIHAWCHPQTALNNASKLFKLNRNQKNIIRSHMFPTTLFHPPLCREAWVVCMADKVCAIKELAASNHKMAMDL